MNFQERLKNMLSSQITEGVESTADIISNNLIASFDEMGMANVTPGEFSQEEITDQENLVNKANMANDNNFNKDSMEGSIVDMAKEVMDDLVDISGDDSDMAAIEITKSSDNYDENCECGCKDGKECECDHKHKGMFGESTLGKIIESTLNGKTCEQYMEDLILKESNYAGPLSFVPDLRINVADVISALKHDIGEGSEGIHVDQVYDDKRNNAYKVSQIDLNKLPKKIQVENVLLELDGDTYRVNKPSTSFPLAR